MQKFSLDLFENISSSDISPVYSWIWNSPISRELIDEQLGEMIQQGIRAVYILPEPKEFRPDSMVTCMAPEYLSNEFFELVKYAVERAASLHISMWLYDEGGWPSGNACGTIVKKFPDARPKRIAEKTVVLDAGDALEKEDFIAAFTKDYKRLELPFVAKSQCEVLVYYVEQRESSFTHIIDPRVLNDFLEGTYEGYKKHLGECFGNEVGAIFTDEPLIEYPYYIGDVSEFEKEYGHSFGDNVYALFTDNPMEEQKQFKVDYIEYCMRVFDERFVKPVSDWCRKNNILFTGHFDGDHILTDSGFRRQVGNLMPHLRLMDIPGIDAILRQIYPSNPDNTFFPRFASSAAHQTGKNLAVSESFSVYGNGITFEQMRYVCNFQFARGINIINFMNIPSGRDKCLFAQMRPQYVPELPEFTFRKEFNDYISRMMYLCQFGKIQCDTALYMPMRDVWAGEDVESDFWSMGKTLEENQVYFDVIDDEFIINNQMIYKDIYIPKNRFMNPEAKKNLENCGARLHYSAENAKGTVKCNCKDVRVMKRVSGDESLYIIFNESDKKITAEMELDETKSGYIADCTDGCLRKMTGRDITLMSGEAVGILFTDAPMKTKERSKPLNYKLLKNFEVTPLFRTEFVNQQLCRKTDDIVIDEGFSGMACYKTRFEYDGEGDLLADLGNVRYYAEIKVNGKAVKRLVMPPYTAVIEGKYLQKENFLEITVANTSANAYVCADYSNAPINALGPYHERTLAFERDNLGFGIAEVKLFKTECEGNKNEL